MTARRSVAYGASRLHLGMVESLVLPDPADRLPDARLFRGCVTKQQIDVAGRAGRVFDPGTLVERMLPRRYARRWFKGCWISRWRSMMYVSSATAPTPNGSTRMMDIADGEPVMG